MNKTVNVWPKPTYAEGFEDGAAWQRDRYRRNVWTAYVAGIVSMAIPTALALIIIVAVV